MDAQVKFASGHEDLAFTRGNVILAAIVGIAILAYSPADVVGILGGLAGASIAITIIFKLFRFIPKITRRIDNSNRISLAVALSVYLIIWVFNHLLL